MSELELTELDIERMICELQAATHVWTPWELQFIEDIKEANDGGFLSARQVAKLEELHARILGRRGR